VFETFFRDRLAPLTLRLALGLVGIFHGFIKIMANGGMTWHLNMPVGYQLLLAWGEFGAGLAILLGLRCRWAAAGALGVLSFTQVWQHGWNVLSQPVRTLEPTLVLLLSGLALLFLGAGELSLDARGGGTGSASRGVKKKQAA